MAQLSAQQINAVLNSKAKALSKPQAQKQLVRENDFDSDPNVSRGDAFLASLDFDGGGDSEYATHPVPINEIQQNTGYSEKALNKSKLSPAIKNLLVEVDGKAPEQTEDKSLTDMVNRAKAVINRTKRPEEKAATGNVDYSIIKAIVNECLNEYFSKQPLNESANLTGISIKEGKISLVDNKGNVFKAKLEYVGNKNDKK